MEFSSDIAGRHAALVTLFADTFTASDGTAEGQAIRTLVTALLADVPAPDLRVFVAEEDHVLLGAGIFSRMTFGNDARQVFVLAPAAVQTDRQGMGIGQAVLRHGLDSLRREGVDIALTYGDPAYYGKVGFAPIGTDMAPVPQPLQYPQGWLGQSLTTRPLEPLPGPARCVAPLDDPAYW